VQQTDKRMLRRYFADDDGLRIKCSNIPNGPGLAYNGPNPSNYAIYEIQDTGGLTDPVQALIDVTNVLSNEPLGSWPNIDLLFAIDPSIWSVVLENLLTDDDSYVNKGCDFMTYRDPLDGRMHLLQRDANETFTAANWSLTRNFGAANKPVLSRVLAVPELRQRYMAHYRVVLPDLDWAYFGPLFLAQRDLIDAAVQADPKKLYSYQNFLDNFASNVNLPLPGLAGGTVIGLQPFITQRASLLAGIGELTSAGPTISNAEPSNPDPDPGEDVHIAADVAPNGAAVTQVQLYYRTPPSTVYLSVPMLDDGLSGDGAPGDGRYGALLPITAQRGQQVQWYVSATADNAFDSLSFEPVLAERGPRLLDYFAGSNDGVRITEWAYSGGSGEFIELTNLGQTAVDLSGWSLDDGNATPGSFDLSAIGVLQPGQSAVITDAVEASFRTSWALSPDVPVIGELGVVSGNNL
ncbi:MAG: lamin tail domain-containing protein, partial [Xanthomonadales bacterium]|nr:lamin tail domain-containing protein [Xanthomonadales bacterium]